MRYWLDKQPDLALPLILFLLAFFISLHATGALKRVATWLRIVDRPDERKKQAAPVPYLGGAAIFLGVIGALGIALFATRSAYQLNLSAAGVILTGAAVIFLVGLIDDVRGVHALLKLAALAGVCLWLFGHGIGVHRTPWPWANLFLTFLWIAGVSSAFNAIDNTDGLAGSVAFATSIALFVLGWATWQVQFSLLALLVAGGVLGFLHHNMNPASIYMGDGGSFLLGYLLSVLVLFGEWSNSSLQSFVAGCLLVLMPIYDLGLTSLLRLRHGVVRSIMAILTYSDTDHLSHRLRHMGYSHRRMLFVLTGLHVVCCLVALLVARRSFVTALTAMALLGGILLAFAWYVDRRSSVLGLWSVGPAQSSRPS